jgi:hypothetical protein
MWRKRATGMIDPCQPQPGDRPARHPSNAERASTVSTRMHALPIPTFSAAVAVASLRDAIASTSIPQPRAAAPALTDVRLPKLTLTVTARRVRGVPLTLKAGRYLLTVIGDPPSPTSPGGVMLIQLPSGTTLADAMTAAERAGDAAPAFYERSILPGGAEIGEDGISRTVIDLVPGEWVVAGYAMSTEPTTMTVTGAMPAAPPEPTANATLTIADGGIAVTRGALREGENIIRIVNAGAGPEFVSIERVPRRASELAFGGPVASSADQSAGTSMWMPLTLEPGTYVARGGVSQAATGLLAVA